MKQYRHWLMLLLIGLILGSSAQADSSGWLKLFGAKGTKGGTNAQLINDYLASKNSPLFGEGERFMKWGQYFNVDPRLMVAISGAETTFGQSVLSECPFNAWNWKDQGHFWDGFAPGWDSDTNRPEFNNAPGFTVGQGLYMETGWEDGMFWVTRTIRQEYLDKGLDTVDKIQPVYCTSGGENWLPNVKNFLAEMGGDSNDLDFPDGTPPLNDALQRCFNRNGGEEHFGNPVDGPVYPGGTVRWYDNNGTPSLIAQKDGFAEAYSAYGDICKRYAIVPGNAGGCGGSLGWPVTSGYEKDQVDGWEWDENHTTLTKHGCLTRFEHGTIYEHLAGSDQTAGVGELGCFVVYGDIRDKYDSMDGCQSYLGFPIRDQIDAAISDGAAAKGWCTKGCLSRFAYGEIYEHLNGNYERSGYDGRGAFEIHDKRPGGIEWKYEAMGGTGSTALGFPISDEGDTLKSKVSGKSGRYNLFEGGTINKWDGGTFAVYGKIFDFYKSNGYSSSDLGFPVSDQINNRQDFEGGYIYIDGNGNAQYSLNTAPAVTGIYPASGSNASSTIITITGSHFVNVSAVKLGSNSLSYTCVSETEITATIPSGLTVGTYDITVTNNNGTSGTGSNTKFVTTIPPPVGPIDVLKIIVGLDQAPPEVNELDRNGNGVIDVGDAVLILQYTRKPSAIKINRQSQAGNFNSGLLFVGALVARYGRRKAANNVKEKYF